MSDRLRNPDRTGFIADETPSDLARHPASPSPVVPPEADRAEEFAGRPDMMGDQAEGLARTLRDLIRSLPPQPVAPSRGLIGTTPRAIAEIVPHTFEDHSTIAPRPKSEDDSRESDAASFGLDRNVLSAVDGPEVDSGYRPDPSGVDRRGDVAIIPSVSPLLGSLGGETVGHSTSDRPRDPIEGIAIAAPSPGGWTAGAGAAEGPDADETRTVSPEPSVASSAVIALATSGEPRADLGRSSSRQDWTEPTTRAGISNDDAPSEMLTVGPVGPAGHLGEGFDRASAEPDPALRWGGSPDDPFGPRSGAVSPGDGETAGIDLSPTNALLGQILDELRRRHQAVPIASGRSVYPER